GQYVLVSDGFRDFYYDLMRMHFSQSMSDPVQYERSKLYMDFDSFIDHHVANLFFANTDWPGNNQKFWRASIGIPGQPADPWKWFVNDMDFGFDLNYYYVTGQPEGPAFNMFTYLMNPTEKWPNYAYDSEPFRKLIQNTDFRNQ